MAAPENKRCTDWGGSLKLWQYSKAYEYNKLECNISLRVLCASTCILFLIFLIALCSFLIYFQTSRHWVFTLCRQSNYLSSKINLYPIQPNYLSIYLETASKWRWNGKSIDPDQTAPKSIVSSQISILILGIIYTYFCSPNPHNSLSEFIGYSNRLGLPNLNAAKKTNSSL